ncbi:peptide ABC transporter substrate-binding protein [Rhodovibrionaceae bacterium A322]
MTRSWRAFHLTVFLLAALLLAGQPLLARDASAAGDSSLTIGITQYPSTLNPNIDSMLAKSYILGMTSRPLTQYDDEWRLFCLLCTELPNLEDGTAWLEDTPDGKKGIAVTYTINPEATWGDGTPVSTEDVLFTWQVGRHPKSGVSNSELYRRIRSITVKDQKTFVFHLDKVTFDYAAATDFRLLPAHVERPIFEKDPAQYRNRTAFDTDPTNPALSFGPYSIARLERGSEIELLPNSRWWGEPPAFDRIIVRTIENTAALEANLLSGAIDMVAGELGFSLDQALAFEKRHGSDYNIIYKPGLIYEHIDLNLDNPLLQLSGVRKALIMGIDRQAISEKLFQGTQPVADSSVSPLDWIYHPDARHYVYDPKTAVELLEEMGFTEIKKGIRYNASGDKLSFEFMTTAGNRTRELVQQVIKSQLKKIGVEVVIRNEPARVFFGQTVTQRKFTGLAMFAWYSSPENPPRSTLYSNEVPTAANGWSGQNYTGYKNVEMDKLIDQIEVELNRSRRKALWGRLQDLYTEDLPVLPLFWRAEAYVLPTWLKGVRPTGHQGTTTLWIERWYSSQ